MHVIRFLCLMLAGTFLQAAGTPQIPASDRILSTEEVRNFWINTIRNKPLPPQATGLHPEKQRARKKEISQRRKLMSEIRGGSHDVAVRLATLSHNAAAWRKLGNADRARENEEELRALREHLQKIATLSAQRELAVKTSVAIDQIRALESEIAALRQQVANQNASHHCAGCH